MTKIKALLVLSMFVSLNALAGANRELDGATITNGSAVLTLPTTTDTILGRATTDTLTNKTLTAPVLSGTITGTYTLGGTPTVPASAISSGTIAIANGGTGQTSANNAFNALAPSQSTHSGKFLTTDGSNTSWATIPATAPGVTGSQASPTAITAVGGISFSGTNYFNIIFVEGSGGAVDVTANPQIAAATNVGQQLMVIGTSAANTVKLDHGTGLSLNGSWTGGDNSAITLVWDGSAWTEIARR